MRHDRRLRVVPLVLVAALAAAVLLSGCSADAEPDAGTDPAQVDATAVPELGACRELTPQDVAAPSNAGRAVDCADPHTAETFAVGELPAEFADAAYDARELGGWAYRTCSTAFQRFLGADESLVMRTVVSWAWFRPSEQAWEDGARWYRCDIVGGGEESTSYAVLPTTARGLLQGPPKDTWMVCAVGESVTASPKLPCTEDHDWRAVSTIKLGEKDDPYPGDRLAEVRTRDFCSDQVGAWLGYPPDFQYAYTWFHAAEWEAGNRRSVCWARTAQ